MFQIIPLQILLLSGVLSISLKKQRPLIVGSIISSVLFMFLFFKPAEPIRHEIFSIKDLSFGISLVFSRPEVLICAMIPMILLAIHLSEKRLKTADGGKILPFLNIFSFFMCFSVLSSNIFQFFIGIEAMGLISVALVGMSEHSFGKVPSRVFAFNKFASLLFLIATCLIGISFKTFEFSEIQKIILSDGFEAKKLWLPGVLLLVSCLCKGVQFPFAYWILDAIKAHILASILIHSATIVAISVIFISKFYFVFELFPEFGKAMIYSGAITAIFMGICSLFSFEAKHIMAYLTSSTMGLMFIACGLGEYSVSLIYLICHAFYKSLLFLSFYFLITAMSGEGNILKLGGLSKVIPKVADMIWIAVFASIGIPFFVSFFAKLSFAGAVDLSGKSSLYIIGILANIISTVSIFRLLFNVLYGQQKSDERTMARGSEFDKSYHASFFLLLGFAIAVSFFAWSMHEWGWLHFGKSGMVYSRDFVDYFIENAIEIAQIIVSVMLALSLRNVRPKQSAVYEILLKLFKKHAIYNYIIKWLQVVSLSILLIISKIDARLLNMIHKKFAKIIYYSGIFISSFHKRVLASHILWVLLGLIGSILSIIIKRS